MNREYSSTDLITKLQKSGIRAILLDMDGILYHGTAAIPGALDFMQAINEIPHAFITNNPIRLPVDVADKMEKMGFSRPRLDRIITSGEATAKWLSEQKPGFNYFAIGAEGLHQSLSKYGNENTENADYVVVGEGRGLDYDSMTTAINLIVSNKARLISTNPDITVDATDSDGKRIILPGGGALVSPIVTATGVQPVTIGKPYPLLYETALKQLGVLPSQCLMIGDRPDTDILGAQNLGMKTALVRTGRFSAEDHLPAHQANPDHDCQTLQQLLAALEQ
jgi:HAD superfamily hydrolase (TIGR01450 family)